MARPSGPAAAYGRTTRNENGDGAGAEGAPDAAAAKTGTTTVGLVATDGVVLAANGRRRSRRSYPLRGVITFGYESVILDGGFNNSR